jgi:hypothetical protein
MARTLVLALSLLALTAGQAQATAGRGSTDFEVVVVPGFTLADLERVENQGAVGLLVPGAGPETSSELARAALVRGEVRNSLRDGLPEGEPLLSVTTGSLGSASGPAIYLGLPEGGRQPNDRRYPVLVVGHGFEGLLTSGSTRIDGLVSVADVAPTVLGEEDALGFEPEPDAAAELLELDERIDANNRARFPAELVACALVALLALVMPRAAVPALAAVLLANLVLGIVGISALWAVLLVIAASAALGGPLFARACRSPLSLGLLLAGTIAAYLVALGLDGAAVALSPFGPTQNARFFGLSNLLETMLLLPAFGAAALLAARLGWAAFGGVALLAFVTVAGNRFGADGGGAIVLAIGFAVLGVLLADARRRALVIAVAGAVILALGLLAVDAATGSESHVTRALRGGPVELAEDLGERVSLSTARATRNWYVALLLVALLLALALLVARTLVRRGISRETAVPLALAAALAASLVVNDSPNDVLLVGLAAYLAADRGMLPARWPAPSRSLWPRSPSPSPSPAAAARRPSRPRPRP